MRELTSEQRRRRRTFLYLWMLLALLVLLVAASYTWFSLTQTPKVSDMAIHVNSTTGIEFATAYDADDEEWGESIDFLDLVSESAPLKPVTWSEKNQRFYTIVYGLDGRMAGAWQELNDEDNANRDDGDGYYVVGSFYARTGEPCVVSLQEAVEVNKGEGGTGTYVIGAPVWDEQSIVHKDAGNGAETAVRIGFKITSVNSRTGQLADDADFYIYEPNCDKHIGEADGYVDTPSIDGTEVLGSQMILQTASEWTEAYPVERDVTIKTLGEFEGDTELFELTAGEIVRIDLYIWLEGQDIDCTNVIQEAQIISCIQFYADYTEQSGLVEIPSRR